MARIKDLVGETPNKDSVIVFDGETGSKKVPLGDLASLVGSIRGIAGFHNSIFRGANLKERFGISNDTDISNEVARRIADGTFDDLFVGDYFTVSITTEYGTESVDVVLAGFDIYMGSIYEYFREEDDYNPIARHHAVCVTRKQFAKSHRMHSSTPIPTEGYRETEMFTTTLPKYATALNSVMGGHIIEICDTYAYDRDDTLTSSSDASLTGVNTSWDYDSAYPAHLTLLTERELYGAPAYSSGPCEVGFETSQLPLFRLDTQSKITSSWYWLQDLASSSYFCDCGSNGGAYFNNATYARGVRPRFLIG